MRGDHNRGRTLAIGSCGFMSSRLAVTFGAKLAYNPMSNPNRHFKPNMTTLGRAPYCNVLFVEDCAGNFKGGVYDMICEALGYDHTGAENPLGFYNPYFFRLDRPKKISDKELAHHIEKIAARSFTDTIIFPYFSVFGEEWQPMQDRVDKAVSTIGFLADKGFDVIYTTPPFADDDFIKDGSWTRNSFFKSADFSLFLEDNEYEDRKILRRLCRGMGKPYSVAEPVLDRLAFLDANDLAALGESFA